MSGIPTVFDQPGAGFVHLPAGLKYPPLETAWQDHPHNYARATRYAAKGGNVGVIAGNGYIGFDQDVPEAFKGLELPTTTMWETRPGRLGMWFKCSDITPELLSKYGKKPDHAQFHLFKDGEHIGEIKLQRSYQVIPNSQKFIDPKTGEGVAPGTGMRIDYKLLDSSPPEQVSLAWLLEELLRLGVTYTSKLDANAGKLERKAAEARQRHVEPDEKKARRYAEAALKDESLTLAGTPAGCRNDQLNKSAFALGQFVATGVLSEAEVVDNLFEAASHAGLTRDEMAGTIKSGLEAGAKHPRVIPDDTKETLPEEIVAKAQEILQNGDPIKFITDSCSRSILGAEKAFRKLICCVAAQDVLQTEGLHPKLNGESGSGKTAVVMMFAHHLPKEAVVKGSMSNKAAFYHKVADRVLRTLDDYRAGNEDLDTVIKQTTSLFHERYQHRTVANHAALTLEIGSEQTWAITSVDSSQDIQVLNRQIPINVDDSVRLTKEVNNGTIARYGKGQVKYPEDENVLISRAIWQILREGERINVRVPFYDRIEWFDTTNRRNPGIFMDLLVAHTAMNRYQRDVDEEGYYLASEADFESAKGLFVDKDAQELVYRLARRERQFADLLAMHPEGLDRRTISMELGVSEERVSKLARGEKGSGGLIQKLSGFSIDEVTDTSRVDEDHRRSVRKTIYRLAKYDALTGFESVVTLHPKEASSAPVMMVRS